MPITFSGRFVFDAISVIEIDDVLVARIQSELQISSDTISDDPYDYVAGSVDYPNYQQENN